VNLQTYSTTGGRGTGCTIRVNATAGACTGPDAIIAGGTDYAIGDVLTLTGGGSGNDATMTVSALGTLGSVVYATTASFKSYGLLMVGSGTAVEVLSYTAKTATSFTGCANVSGTPLTTLTTGVAAFQYTLQIDFQGSTATGDEGRLKDWWYDPEMGVIYFNNSYPFFEWNAIKVTYVFGERYVEKAIEDICTKLVAMDLLTADDRSVLLPEGTTNIDLGSKYQLFKQQVAETLPRYVEVVTLD